MFIYEIRPGIFRLAIAIRRTESWSEIVVFLSASDEPICDVFGELTRTPRLSVRNETLPAPESIPAGYED